MANVPAAADEVTAGVGTGAGGCRRRRRSSRTPGRESRDQGVELVDSTSMRRFRHAREIRIARPGVARRRRSTVGVRS
jgi:hypothetical protein